jgi:23S rRNA (uracil1939-C5)-methyltransferase
MVVGIEGSDILCARAQDNAELNHLGHKTKFIHQNLFIVTEQEIPAWGKFARWLIDPPREGAFAIALALAKLKGCAAEYLPQRIVYVSCNPATLARDADILVHQVGYQLRAAGVVNMFPHTNHIESIAVFDLISSHLHANP